MICPYNFLTLAICWSQCRDVNLRLYNNLNQASELVVSPPTNRAYDHKVYFIIIECEDIFEKLDLCLKVNCCNFVFLLFADIGRSAATNSPRVRKVDTKQKVSTRALLTSDEYVGDNWLDDDLGICKKGVGKRKRNDPQGMFSTMGTRRQRKTSGTSSSGEEDLGAKRKKRAKKKVEESESETDGENKTTLCADNNETEDFCNLSEVNMGSSRTCTDSNVRVKEPETSEAVSDVFGKEFGRSERETRFNVHSAKNLSTTQPAVNLLQSDLDAHFDIPGSSSDLEIDTLSVPRQNSNATHTLHPTQTKNSSFKNKKSQQLKITNFSTTQPKLINTVNSIVSNVNLAADANVPACSRVPRGPVMRLRVRVKDKQILVPVPHMEAPPKVGWLAKETSNR